MPQHAGLRTPNWIGRTLVDRDGERIGRVEDLYTDDAGGQPAWIAVSTGTFGLNIVFVPFAGAAPAGGDELRIEFPRSLVKEAPVADRGGRLTQEEVVRLYDHYGFDLEAEEVRERAVTRRHSRLRGHYTPASRYGPGFIENLAPKAPEPGAPAEHPGPTAAIEPASAPAGLQSETPAGPPRPLRLRAAGSLFGDLEPPNATEQLAARSDNPLYWNHDDRIDSIRPPRHPARGRRR